MMITWNRDQVSVVSREKDAFLERNPALAIGPRLAASPRWTVFVWWIFLAAGLALLAGLAKSERPGQLARVKDVATIEGIRDNQLVGYGLVVGLRGTGDTS